MGVSSVDSNLMSRNFVSVSSGESKYVKAARVGAQVEQSTSMNRQQAILEAGMAACAAAKTRCSPGFAAGSKIPGSTCGQCACYGNHPCESSSSQPSRGAGSTRTGGRCCW